MRTTDIADSYQSLPDIVTAISDEALLTPETVTRILTESGRLGDFLNNPEAFLEQASQIIRDNRHALAIDGISYIKLDGQEYYAQEIFDTLRADCKPGPKRSQGGTQCLRLYRI